MALATAEVALYVQTAQLATYWDFLAYILVYDWATKAWRNAEVAEVEVKLIEVKDFMPDVVKEVLDTDSSGQVHFQGGAYLSTKYKIEARHKASGYAEGLLIQCNDDGTWTELRRYQL